MSVKTLSQPHRQRLPYVGWRAEELAKLALSRIPNWSVSDTTPSGQFDFAVMDVDKGTMFMVAVEAFSSIHASPKIDLSKREIPVTVPASLVKAAKSMKCPVVLFVFDADTDHGRFRRLNTEDFADVPGEGKVSFYLSIENTINTESMKRLARELGAR